MNKMIEKAMNKSYKVLDFTEQNEEKLSCTQNDKCFEYSHLK